MIDNDAQLDLALAQLGRAYKAPAALRAEVLPRGHRWITLMAEGPVIQIQQLLQELDEYTGAALLAKPSPAEAGADGTPPAEAPRPPATVRRFAPQQVLPPSRDQ
jgi:hypothetical protein